MVERRCLALLLAVLFGLTAHAQGGSLTTLADFPPSLSHPYGALVAGTDGAIYGTLGAATTYGAGQTRAIPGLYRAAPTATGWAITPLALNGAALFAGPLQALTAGPNGTLYAAAGFNGLTGLNGCYTDTSGAHNCMAVLHLVPPAVAGGAWVPHMIAALQGSAGYFGNGFLTTPVALMTGPKGSIIGARQYLLCGKPATSSCGEFFRLAPPATPGKGWNYQSLTTLQSGITSAGSATGDTFVQFDSVIAEDGAGTIYGTLFALSAPDTSGISHPVSLIFRVPPGGAFEVLARYSGLSTHIGFGIPSRGAFSSLFVREDANVLRLNHTPQGWNSETLAVLPGTASTLTIAASGHIFGAIPAGGTGPCINITGADVFTFGCGMIFDLTPLPGSRNYTLNILGLFSGGTDGGTPLSALARTKTGQIIGAVFQGGDASGTTFGTGDGALFAFPAD